MRWLILVFGCCCALSFTSEAKAQSVTPATTEGILPAIAADSMERIKLNRVIIVGNKKTLDRIILRELTMKSGDSILRMEIPAMLVRDKNKIYNLRIFNTVNLRELELPDKSFDLLVEIEERWFTFPIPIFELSDRNFNEWWQNYDHQLNRTNYGLRWYQYNFRGRNESIRLTAQFGYTRKFDITYRIPYLDKKQKLGVIFAVNYGEPKNLAYKTVDHKLEFLSGRETLRRRLGASMTYTYRRSFYETHGLTFQYERGTIADTIQSLNSNYYRNGGKQQWFTAISYDFVSEHRDVIAYPLNGYLFAASIDKVGLGLGEGINQTQVLASFAYHKPVRKNLYFSNFTAFYFGTPETQPYALYFGQGYQNRFVRGYEIYVIEGRYYGLNKSTLKTRLFQRTYKLSFLPWEQFHHLPVGLYFKVHADFGYTRNYNYYKDLNQNTFLTNKLIAGAGAGFDLISSYDAVFRFEYTVNREGAHGFFFNLKKEF